jgi:hypothetical protein
MSAVPSIPSVPERLRTGFFVGLQTSLRMIKWVLPLYIAVDLLKHTPAVDWLGGLFAPLMKYFGLPGEAAFAFIAAFLLNLYAALAILAPLDLTPWQLTQCGLMMGIAHNLLVEGAVLGSTGTRGWLLTLCRVAIALVAGLLLAGAHHLWGN